MDIIKIFSKLVTSNKQKPTTFLPDTNKSQSLPSLDFALDTVKECASRQMARIDGLDNKAIFANGSGVGLLGAALTLQAALPSTHSHSYCTSFVPFVHTWYPLLRHALPLFPLIVSFIFVVGYSLRAFMVRNYNELQPEGLYDYLEEEEVVTKIDIFKIITDNFKKNEEKAKSKAKHINYAFLLGRQSGLEAEP